MYILIIMIKVTHLSGPYSLTEKDKSNENLLKFVSKVIYMSIISYMNVLNHLKQPQCL